MQPSMPSASRVAGSTTRADTTPATCASGMAPGREHVAKAIEVRDKPVSASDVHIFARRCQTDGVKDCAVLMVSPQQAALDEPTPRAWADDIGVNVQLWAGWEDFTREGLFWSEQEASDAAAAAASRVRARLIEAEVSENWDALTSRDC